MVNGVDRSLKLASSGGAGAVNGVAIRRSSARTQTELYSTPFTRSKKVCCDTVVIVVLRSATSPARSPDVGEPPR